VTSNSSQTTLNKHSSSVSHLAVFQSILKCKCETMETFPVHSGLKQGDA